MSAFVLTYQGPGCPNKELDRKYQGVPSSRRYEAAEKKRKIASLIRGRTIDISRPPSVNQNDNSTTHRSRKPTPVMRRYLTGGRRAEDGNAIPGSKTPRASLEARATATRSRRASGGTNERPIYTWQQAAQSYMRSLSFSSRL